MKLRNHLSIALALFGLGFAGSAIAANTMAAAQKAVVASQAEDVITAAKKRRLEFSGSSYSGTPFKTSGNRAQRRRQLQGMLAECGR